MDKFLKYFLSLLLYRLFFLVLLPILVLVLIIRSYNHPQYRYRLLERLGFYTKSLQKQGIIIHAASVGEVIALKAFIEKLLKVYPTLPITVTTFTPTGSEQVLTLFSERVQHCYLPLDCVLSTHLFLKKLQPKAIVFMETELWPNIIAQCAQRNIKLLLINGRLSMKSMKSYHKLGWLITPTIKHFDQILTQSQSNQENFLALGSKEKYCRVSGNLKFDIAVNDSIIEKQTQLAQFIEGKRNVWVVASTHPGDEEIILSAYKKLITKHPDLLLVIVPRHPERFEQVGQLCETRGFSTVKRSNKTPIMTSTQIWLLDTLGELMPMFSLANVVTMGGSFSHIGGHNPLEPALFKKPIVVGSDMNNFTDVMIQLKNAGGVVQLEEGQQNIDTALIETITKILSQPELQNSLGNSAYQVVRANQGASERTVECLQQLLGL